MPHEMMFIDPAVSSSDRELFLGPFGPNDGPIVMIEPGWSMAHVVHTAGVFPSVKQAKKNGWDRPIPTGFEVFTVGKTKFKIYVLTKFD